MGLDIRAFEYVTKVDPPSDLDDACEHDIYQAFCYETMERSLRGLQPGAWYQATGESMHFHAGSYGGYNRWREVLCRAVHGVAPQAVWDDPDTYEGLAFYELIHFADNEGTIGPEACSDVAADFDQYREKLAAAFNSDVYGTEKLNDWDRAFRLAAGAGMVRFS